eukprot:jgi/Mesvir1/28859/Mv09984-RA.1
MRQLSRQVPYSFTPSPGSEPPWAEREQEAGSSGDADALLGGGNDGADGWKPLVGLGGGSTGEWEAIQPAKASKSAAAQPALLARWEQEMRDLVTFAKDTRDAEHPEALGVFYQLYTVNCAVERVWKFVLPLALVQLGSSFYAIALMSFISQVALVSLGPWVGHWIDTSCRISTVCTLLWMTAVSIVAGLASVVFSYASAPSASLFATSSSLITHPWFLVLCASQVMERIATMGSEVVFERDWVVQFAGKSHPVVLASANSLMCRLDLLSEVICPFFIGLMLAGISTLSCVSLVGIVCAGSLPLMLHLVEHLNKVSGGMLDKSPDIVVHPDSVAACPTSPLAQLQAAIKGASLPKLLGEWSSSISRQLSWPSIRSSLQAVGDSWSQYVSQPVFPASLTLVLLYFNHGLSPGKILNTYLLKLGVSTSYVGLFQGVCSAAGFISTLFVAAAVRSLGVLEASRVALLSQVACLVVAAAAYCQLQLTSAARTSALALFMGAVALSRIGLWAFDTIRLQVFQNAVPEDMAASVGSAEMSMQNLAEMLMLGVAMLLDRPGGYDLLVGLSFAAVMLGTAVYSRWMSTMSPITKAKINLEEAMAQTAS